MITKAQAIHDYLFNPELVDSDPERWDEILELGEPPLARALALRPDILLQDFGIEEPWTPEDIMFKALLAENCEYLPDETKLELEKIALAEPEEV